MTYSNDFNRNTSPNTDAVLPADLIVMRSMTIKHLCDVRIFIEPEAARMAALEVSWSQLQQLGDLVYI